MRYLLAIATGGAITHTLVPPTPGPLLVAAILGVDIGMMIIIGTLVAIPSAIMGLICSVIMDRIRPVPMRSVGAGDTRHQPLTESQLPLLGVALLPIVLPVMLIGAGTLTTTLADREDQAAMTTADIKSFDELASVLSASEPNTPAGRILASGRLTREEAERLKQPASTEAEKSDVAGLLNEVLLDHGLYEEQAFLGVAISDVAKSKLSSNQLRMKPVDRRRMNRALIEDAYPELFAKHQWDSPMRRIAVSLSLWSNPNFALMLAAIFSMLTLKRVRSLTWRDLGIDVEESLMSGGVIIMITAAGGAFRRDVDRDGHQ